MHRSKRLTLAPLGLFGMLTAVAMPARAVPAVNPVAAPRATQDGTDLVELRVVNASPGGLVEVDRGAADGLEVGDRVLLLPRSGGPLDGVVTVVEERTALVELAFPNADVPAGTRGQATVPASRFAVIAPVLPLAPQETETSAEAPVRWKNADDGYQAGMPLLSDVRVAKPGERPRRFGGRMYLALDQIVATDGGRIDSFYRLGNDLWVENPFGYGGELAFDGEFTYRRNALPDQDDYDLTRYRLDRLSYRIGGTRHAPDSYEFGRILQRGVPEFGFLDGFEYVSRSEGGNRYGGSIGFLPQPKPFLESGEDFGVSGFYEWNADASERLSAAIGYQHTWHNGAPDRDLVVLRAHSLPSKGWRLFGVTLVDIYTGGDDFRSGVVVTQANVTARREWEQYGLAFRYSRQALPDIEKNDFLAIDPNLLSEDRYDRVSMDVFTDLTGRLRLNTEAGLWVDEVNDGGFGRLGLELLDLIGAGSRGEVEGFLTQGAFTDVIGVRFLLGFADAGGRWDLSYELASQDNIGFNDNNDDLIQHRARVSRDWLTALGWNVSLYADVVSWNSEVGLLAGFFAQKGF